MAKRLNYPDTETGDDDVTTQDLGALGDSSVVSSSSANSSLSLSSPSSFESFVNVLSSDAFKDLSDSSSAKEA